MKNLLYVTLGVAALLASSCSAGQGRCSCAEDDAGEEPDAGGCTDDDPPDPDGGVPGWRMTWAVQAGGDRVNNSFPYDIAFDLQPLPDSSVLVTGRYVYEGLFGAGEPNETLLPRFGSEGDSENTNCFVAMYGRDGALLWARGYGGMQWDAGGMGLSNVTDESFLNVGGYEQDMVIGYDEPNETGLWADSFDPSGTYSFVLARYSADGALEWAIRALDAESGAMLYSLASLPDGSVVVSGWFSYGIALAPDTPDEAILTAPDGGERDAVIARFASDGTLRWARQISGPGGEEVWSLVRLLGGELLVAGTYQETVVLGVGEENETWLTCGEGEPDAGSEGDDENCPFLAAYDENGALAWARDLGYPLPVQDVSPIVQASPDGGFAISGGFEGTAVLGAGEPNETILGPTPDGRFDMLVARYGADGNLLWARQSVGGLDDSTTMKSYIGYPMAFLDSGELVVSSTYNDGAPVFGKDEPNETALPFSNQWRMFVALYYANGNLSWAIDQDGSDYMNSVMTVAALGDGTFFVGGSFGGTATFGTSSEDQVTMTSNGDSEIFVLRFDRTAE